MMKRTFGIRFNAFVFALLAVALCIAGFAGAAEQVPPELTLISNVSIFEGRTEKLHGRGEKLCADNERREDIQNHA